MSRRHLALTLACAMAIAACGVDTELSNQVSPASPGAPTTATTVADTSSTTLTSTSKSGGTTSTTLVDRGDDGDDDDDAGVGEQPTDGAIEEFVETDEPVDVGDDDRTALQPSKTPERVPASDPPLNVGEAPPDLMDAILGHAAGLVGVGRSEFSTVRAEQVVWSDGSLGCPEPGVYYTQATVSGYWIVLEHAATRYDYRARDNGLFRMCESPSSGPTTLNG